MNTGYILLSPYAAPRKCSRDAFVGNRPRLQRCKPAEWIDATRSAIKVDQSIKLATTVAMLYVRDAA